MSNNFVVICGMFAGVRSCELNYDDGLLSLKGRSLQGIILVEIRFPSIVHVQVADEGVRLRTLQRMGSLRGGVMLVEESSLVAWICRETLETRQTGMVQHYLMLIGEEVIDVLSSDPPSILSGSD